MNKVYATGIISILFIVSSCSAIYNTADSIGQHMPVIGQRCENWQCFTQSGQETSEEKIRQQQVQAQNQTNTLSASAPPAAENTQPAQNAGQNQQTQSPPYPSQTTLSPQRQIPQENPVEGN